MRRGWEGRSEDERKRLEVALEEEEDVLVLRRS
jgi:hypothetical protein